MKALSIVVVTGMSGAGRSTALNVLEDLGFFCVDNLPPALAGALVTLLEADEELHKVGFGIDVRTGSFLLGAEENLRALRKRGHQVRVLFFDAGDETLLRRFSASRRPHPLARPPAGDLWEAIHSERERLGVLRAEAHRVFDTTDLNVHDLRQQLIDYIAEGEATPRLVVRLLSFGFKYGLPLDADLVFDVRFLPNPHFIPELRPHTGLQDQVASFVLSQEDAKEVLAEVQGLLLRLLPKFEREGKSYLTVALGCTGGRHRSVALVEALAQGLSGLGTSEQVGAMNVIHRDVDKPVL